MGVIWSPAISVIGTPGFSPLKIGGGGFMMEIDMQPDGTKLTRTDAYGLYLSTSANSTWTQLITMSSMPSGGADSGIGFGQGAYALAISPSNTSRFYMEFKGLVYRSDNKGINWIRTTRSFVSYDSNEAPMKQFNSKLAIDPINPDVCYSSTPSSGLFVTFNAGATWVEVGDATNPVKRATTPAGASTGGGHLISFDSSAGTVSVSSQTRTKNIYVSTYGTGVYKSADGGVTWTLTTGAPTDHMYMMSDTNGKVWFCALNYPDNTQMWTYTGTGSWANVNVGFGQSVIGVAINPANTSLMYAVDHGGVISVSTNGGTSWNDSGPPSNPLRSATDIPWLAVTDESFFSTSMIRFDPFSSNKLFIAEGVGVWWTNPPLTNASITWNSQTAGIENMVANKIVSPSGGRPIIAFWDRPVFRSANANSYPTTHGVNMSAAHIESGWSCDYASADPTFICTIANDPGNNNDDSGYSTNGGITWTPFSGKPAGLLSGKIGGAIAASTSLNILWMTSGTGGPFYTLDGGANWNAISNPAGVTITAGAGWSSNYYWNNQTVCADRVLTNTFYMYNYNDGTGTQHIFRSIDGGATWTDRGHPTFQGNIFIRPWLRSAPGNAGHLYFCAGDSGGTYPQNQPLQRSTNGGISFTALPNVKETWCVGFGASKPGGSGYPSVYIYGWVTVGGTDTLGVWRSDDCDQVTPTWHQLGDGFPAGNFSEVSCIEGDGTTWNVCYLGTMSASCFIYS